MLWHAPRCRRLWLAPPRAEIFLCPGLNVHLLAGKSPNDDQSTLHPKIPENTTQNASSVNERVRQGARQWERASANVRVKWCERWEVPYTWRVWSAWENELKELKTGRWDGGCTIWLSCVPYLCHLCVWRTKVLKLPFCQLHICRHSADAKYDVVLQMTSRNCILISENLLHSKPKLITNCRMNLLRSSHTSTKLIWRFEAVIPLEKSTHIWWCEVSGFSFGLKVCHDISTPQMGATLVFFFILFFFYSSVASMTVWTSVCSYEWTVWTFVCSYECQRAMSQSLWLTGILNEVCYTCVSLQPVTFHVFVKYCSYSFLWAKSFSSSSLYPFMHKFTCLSNQNVVTNVHIIQ